MNILRFLFAFLLAVPCWAATPSFQSFDTNDFIAIPPTVKLRHVQNGGTNIFNDVTIINTNVTVFNSFTTNIIDNSVTIITNSIVNITNTTVTINGTNVATINETIGRVPYKSGTNTFSDSSLVFVDTNTTETVNLWTENVGVTNLVTGGLVVSFDSGLGFGYLTNFPAGTGTLANDGANHIFWDTSGQIWTNNAGVVTTTVGFAVVATNVASAESLTTSGAFITSAASVDLLVAGTNTLNPFQKSMYFLAPTAPGCLINLNSGHGQGQHLWLFNVFSNSTPFMLTNGPLADNPLAKTVVRDGFWSPTQEGESIELIGSPNGWVELGRSIPTGASPALGVNYWTNILGVLLPTDTNIVFKLSPGDVRLEDATGVANFEHFVDNQNTGFAARILDTNGFNHAMSLNINPYSMDGNTGFLYQLGLNTMWSMIPGNTNFPPYRYDTFSTVSSTNLWQLANHSTNQITLGPLAQIGFGEGSTNVLYRDGNHLVYTNSGTVGNGVLFKVANGNATTAGFGVDQSDEVAITGSVGTFIRLEPDNSSSTYTAAAIGFYPSSTNQILGFPDSTNIYWKSTTIGSSNQWAFKGVTVGATTNITININGTNFSFIAF